MSSRISRRAFLGQSAAVGAVVVLPSIITRSASGAESANEKIALASIGVGSMGMTNMKSFVGLDDCQIVAVCDPYEGRCQKAKEFLDAKYGDTGCAMYGDYRDVIARDDIDGVIITVQDHWHALIATAAAKAGKDMYCEKPLGVSVEECQIIRDVVRDEKRVFQTGTWQRSKAVFQQACRLARNGYVGKIHTVEVAAPGPTYQPKYDGAMDSQPVPDGFNWEMWRGPAPETDYNPGRVAWPDWYLIWDYCVGFITNWGVHHLDIANWGCPTIGDSPFEVECKANYREKGFTDNVEGWDGTFVYPDGLKVVFKDSSKLKQGCKFIGDEGWVHVDRKSISAAPESLLTLEFKDTDQMLTDSTNHGGDLLACMRTRKDPVSDVDAAYTASSLGMQADVAARLGKKLAWDPKAERFTNSDEANTMLHRDMHNGWKL